MYAVWGLAKKPIYNEKNYDDNVNDGDEKDNW